MRRSRIGSISLMLAVTLAAAWQWSSSNSLEHDGGSGRDDHRGATTTAGGATTTAGGATTTSGSTTGGCKAGTAAAADPHGTVAPIPGQERSGSSSTSPVAATSRSTTPPLPASTRRRPTLASPARSRRPPPPTAATGPSASSRSSAATTSSSPTASSGRAPVTIGHPEPDELYAIVDDVVDAPERAVDGLWCQRRLVPGRGGGGLRVEDRQDRLHRRRQNDLIKKFEVGFVAGVKQVNPNATVEIKYLTQPPDFTGFNDAAKGKSTAAAMYSSGIDVIYHAAGASGTGLFQAARPARSPARSRPSVSTPTSTSRRRPTSSPTSSPRR